MAPREQTDAELVRLAREGDVEAFTEIVRRHEVLRTRFVSVAGEPRQVIEAAGRWELPVEEISGLDDRESVARKMARAEAARGFELRRGGLLRTRLLRLGRTEHVLLVTMHHIVSDGWSRGVLIRELSALYEAYRRREESPLAELEIQYSDYAVWQRGWLQGEVVKQQLDYWRQQLAGVEALELPTDYLRPGVRSGRGRSVEVRLTAAVGQGLEAMSRREGVTVFMVVLASVQVLLSRYSGQADVVVGSPIANRNRVETEQLIGFFVNTLVLRARNKVSAAMHSALEGDTTGSWYRMLNPLLWAWRGVSPIEIHEVLARIAASDAERSNPQRLDTVVGYRNGNWIYEWIHQGMQWQQRATEQQDPLVGGEYWLKAASLYSIAGYPHLKGDELAEQAEMLANRAYEEAAMLLPYQLKELEFRIEGGLVHFERVLVFREYVFVLHRDILGSRLTRAR